MRSGLSCALHKVGRTSDSPDVVTASAGATRTALLMMPLIPIALATWAIARQFTRMYECVRLRSLESVAIAAAATAGWTLNYGFLELAGASAPKHVHLVAGHGRSVGTAWVRPRLVRAMRKLVRELRMERGWSQGELADKLEVSRQTVNAIETERYDPSLPLAFAIGKLFGKPIAKIFLPEK